MLLRALTHMRHGLSSSTGADMANYNVVIPTITSLCAHIGVSNSQVGLIIGACDIATVCSTMGASLRGQPSHPQQLVVPHACMHAACKALVSCLQHAASSIACLSTSVVPAG